jgi:hypothetical protein
MGCGERDRRAVAPARAGDKAKLEWLTRVDRASRGSVAAKIGRPAAAGLAKYVIAERVGCDPADGEHLAVPLCRGRASRDGGAERAGPARRQTTPTKGG